MPCSDQQSEDLLSDHSLSPLAGLHYIPDYLTVDEQSQLLTCVIQSKTKWTQVKKLA